MNNINPPSAPCPCHPKNLETDGFPKCFVCKNEMCPQTLEYGTTLCGTKCRYNRTITDALPRDKYNQVIDPGNGKAIATCICGGVWAGGLNNCQIMSYRDSNHKRIIPTQT